MGDFYETGIEIWAGFGPVGITEKKRFGAIMSKFFLSFHGQKKFKTSTKGISSSKRESDIFR